MNQTPTDQADAHGISGSSSSGSRPKQGREAPSIWEIYFPQHVSGHRDSVYIASFPEILYLWPTVACIFLAALLQAATSLSPGVLGWIVVSVFALNLLVYVQDFDQKKFLILVLVLFVLTLLVWIINLYGFTFLSRIAGRILSLNPAISTDAYLLLGSFLSLLLLWGLITPLFSYWKLEQNEFIHYSQPVGKDMSIARAGCSVYKEIPDVFETILGFGAGTLIIRKDNQVLASIPHIPFLGLRMESIEHLLSETRVVIHKEH